MRIQALNVSLPKVVVYKGEEVLTGIYKVSTAEPLMVRRLNIDGDEQADLTVHGGVDKAVYAFPAEHYSYYQETLNQDPYEPGQFGENLTTKGMLESDVHIGDRYRVGEVVFEVSQPRSPCYKFAIKMGTTESLSACINSAKTGFYFRVLSEGIVQSGDRIEVDYSNDTAPTVEEVHRLYYFDKKNIDGLTKAAQCDSLARVFRDEFENRISKLAAKPQQ
jgi:MOSC domain-containing protein YiiM